MNSVSSATICCLALALTAGGQVSATSCGDLTYGDKNQIDYGPFCVRGTVRGTSDSQGVAVPSACVGVFTELDHKLVAVTRTDDRGQSELQDIPVGDY